MAKLNQVLAIEKNVKSHAYGEITELDKANQKPTLFDGFNKIYTPRVDDGEALPPEIKRVQMRVKDVLKTLYRATTQLLDTTATKDYANCDATADVIVDGVVLVPNAPVTFLLFLEKQMTDLRTFCDRLPTLDSSEDWELDHHHGVYKSRPTSKHRTKKIEKPIVMYPHSAEHPAQTQMVSEDIVVGDWTTVRVSGAIPPEEKEEIVARIDRLLNAVKYAREHANVIEAHDQRIATHVLGFIFDNKP